MRDLFLRCLKRLAPQIPHLSLGGGFEYGGPLIRNMALKIGEMDEGLTNKVRRPNCDENESLIGAT